MIVLQHMYRNVTVGWLCWQSKFGGFVLQVTFYVLSTSFYYRVLKGLGSRNHVKGKPLGVFPRFLV